MKSYPIQDLDTRQKQALLLAAVAPRPIAFASTIDKDGKPNLAPFSFFNAFSANPPVLVFSPARRGRDNTTKHTLDNIKEVPQVVINVVTKEMAEQMSLSSQDFPKGVNEFQKAGFTPLPSLSVRPFRVKESPIQFECEVENIIELGQQGGAGNLVICHIRQIHLSEHILSKGQIDYRKLHLIGRMGGDDYINAFGEALFRLPKPISIVGVGIDALPDPIRRSEYLTGSELARLGSVEKLPPRNDKRIGKLQKQDFLTAKSLIQQGEIERCLRFLLS